MNPTNNEASVAPPAVEQAPVGVDTGLNQGERPAAAPERAYTPSPGAAVPPQMPTIALPLGPTPSLPSDTSQPTAGAASSTASQPIIDDGDLIEKEWVHKAKQIVEQTRDDPHKQTEELTVFKADYMQKRYGKTIKLNQ